MSTTEMVCWIAIAIYVTLALIAVAFLFLSGAREHPESDALVAQADEARRVEVARG